MTYFEQLHPWCIIKPLPNLQRCIVARFRRRNEAESHLQVIRRLMPHITYSIVFDPTPQQEEGAEGDIRSVPQAVGVQLQGAAIASRENSSIFPDTVSTFPE